nr:Crp/Fnr family transcriptional regulator [uncultured Roseateles sp.]
MSPKPSQNKILSALPLADWEHLSPQLEWIEMPAGTLLHEAGSLIRHVYFPVTAVASLISTMKSGAAAEIAVVGNEGMVGVCAFMGGAPSLSSAVVQSSGYGLRMGAAALRAQSQRSEPLMQQLLHYTQTLFAQMTQTSACNRHHGLDQQLCRWLLQHLDRQQGNEMVITQERIAAMLGVRREGVTGGALKLQKAGLIRYGRGHLTVVDRNGLEARSCECYAIARGAEPTGPRAWSVAAPASQIRKQAQTM